MNKQEFQQTIKNMKPPEFFTAITLSEAYKGGFEEAKGNALFNSNFLNESEKPVVPQYVADYIDSERNSGSTLSEALGNMYYEQRIADWFYINSETFAKAWLYGYETEKEKLYTVELPSPNCPTDDHYILSRLKNGKIIVNRYCIEQWEKFGDCQLTEAEIKQDFDWAWQFAKEVEE